MSEELKIIISQKTEHCVLSLTTVANRNAYNNPSNLEKFCADATHVNRVPKVSVFTLLVMAGFWVLVTKILHVSVQKHARRGIVSKIQPRVLFASFNDAHFIYIGDGH